MGRKALPRACVYKVAGALGCSLAIAVSLIFGVIDDARESGDRNMTPHKAATFLVALKNFLTMEVEVIA